MLDSMTHEQLHDPEQKSRIVPAAIIALILLYAMSLVGSWPQRGTEAIVAGGKHEVAGGEASEHRPETFDQAAAETVAIESPPLWTVIPFVLLLAGDRRVAADSRHRTLVGIEPPAVSSWRAGLRCLTLAYYAFLHRTPLEGHWPAHHVVEPADGAVQGGFVRTILENAILQEFIPFIVLLFSLYTISGGIRIAGDLQAHPLTNAAFMAVGRPAGQLHRHDRRGDAADSPAAGNQPRAQARRPHGRVLHLHRLQLRRLPAADRRSAAVPGLSARRAVSVDARACGGSGCSSTGC